jgi:ketosteroid isomerase-like protein
MSIVSPSIAAPVLNETTQVLSAFFHALDLRRYDRMLDLFTEDCRWLRQGQWLQGKPAVLAALEARDPQLETRHVMTNAYVSAMEGGTVELEAYQTAYRFPTPPRGATALPQVTAPLRFNLVTTVFRRDSGYDWRIAEQRMVAAFAFTE